MNTTENKYSLILVGAGGHAKSCINLIESIQKYSIQGILSKERMSEHEILGYPIIGKDNDLPNLINEKTKAIVSIGQIKSAKTRIKLYELIKSFDICAPALISPFSSISKHVEINEGTIAMHGICINANTRIGVNCILNTGSIIEHDVSVGNHCHISTVTKLNGNVVIEDECFIGSGATIKEGITIGKGSIIGMGENVFNDCPPGSIISRLKELK